MCWKINHKTSKNVSFTFQTTFLSIPYLLLLTHLYICNHTFLKHIYCLLFFLFLMEQARYWMLTKRKHSTLSNSNVFQMPSSATSNPSPISSYDHDSWEEQAFAEDAAGGLGGCIWPPRSYSCSFCKREFRSAQALGGHMNVHRRDRARLKQSPTSTSTTPPPPPPHHQINLDNHHHNNPFTNALFHHYPNPQDICTLVYNNNPNPDKSDPPLNASPTRVSLLSCEKAFFPPFSSSSTNVMQQHHKRSSASSPPRSSTDEEELIKNHSRIVESTDHLSVSLNLVVRRAHRPAASDDDEKELQEEDRIYKKRRIDDSSVASLAPFVVKSKKSVEMINLCSLEELDLELRLGQRPKVN